MDSSDVPIECTLEPTPEEEESTTKPSTSSYERPPKRSRDEISEMRKEIIEKVQAYYSNARSTSEEKTNKHTQLLKEAEELKESIEEDAKRLKSNEPAVHKDIVDSLEHSSRGFVYCVGYAYCTTSKPAFTILRTFLNEEDAITCTHLHHRVNLTLKDGSNCFHRLKHMPIHICAFKGKYDVHIPLIELSLDVEAEHEGDLMIKEGIDPIKSVWL